VCSSDLSVNWFRVDEDGKFIWPGFGDNMRVIKWIADRVSGRAEARETPLGYVPEVKDLNLQGLNIPRGRLEKLFEVRPGEWQEELKDIKSFLDQFGRHLPYEISQNYASLADRLGQNR
jgi:phosphoenolpyruvate carboxykinase (GTP)